MARKILSSAGLMVSHAMTGANLYPPASTYQPMGIVRVAAVVRAEPWRPLAAVNPIDAVSTAMKAAFAARIVSGEADPDGSRLFMTWPTFHSMLSCKDVPFSWRLDQGFQSDRERQRVCNQWLEANDLPRIDRWMASGWLPDGVVLLVIGPGNLWEVEPPNRLPRGVRGSVAILVK